MFKIFFFILTFFSLQSYGSDFSSLEKVTQQFQKICFSKEGQFLEAKIYRLDGNKVDCRRDLLFINQQIEKAHEEDLKLCEADGFHPDIKNILDISQVLENGRACPNKAPTEKSCLEDLTCNIVSTLAVGTLLPLQALNLRDSTKIPKCLNPESSCMVNLLRGVWDSLYSTVNAVWSLATGAFEEEQLTSEKLMLAQQTSPSAVDRFKKDPRSFLNGMVKSLYSSISEGIKENYGCGRWSGLPYRSECLEPMPNWECGSCSQRFSAICGVIGFGGGEILSAYLTGGAIAASKTVISTIGKGGAQVVARLGGVIEKFPGITYAKNAAIETKNLAHLKTLRSWDKFRNSAPVRAIKEASLSLSTGKKKSKTFAVVGGAVTIAVKPVQIYFELMGKSFGTGYRQVDKALNREIALSESHLSKLSEVRKPLSTEAEEIIKLRLREADQDIFWKIANATGDKLSDPQKLNYVLDEITGLTILEADKKGKIVNSVITNVNHWSPKNFSARLSQYRQSSLASQTRTQEQKLKLLHPQKSTTEIEQLAKVKAYEMRARKLELARNCSHFKPNVDNKKASALYSKASIALGVGLVPGTFALANWHEVKDRQWAKRLGYEVVMAYIMAKWGSKITTKPAPTLTGKMSNGYKISSKLTFIESAAYVTLFGNDKTKAENQLKKLSQSPTFDQDMRELEKYVSERSKMEEFMDKTGDHMNNLLRVLSNKGPVTEFTLKDLEQLDQKTMKDPLVLEKMMDMVGDQIYSESLDGKTYGNQFLDRAMFDLNWNVTAVPRSVLVGMLAFRAVCSNIDNPVNAIAAFGLIQGTNKLGSGIWYYHHKNKEINQ
jgi:hypothetical protein